MQLPEVTPGEGMLRGSNVPLSLYFLHFTGGHSSEPTVPDVGEGMLTNGLHLYSPRHCAC